MSRLRIRDERVYKNWTDTHVQTARQDGNCSAPLVDTVLGSWSYSFPMGSYVSMSDDVIPGYHKRVKNGEVFYNGMLKRTVVIGGSGNASMKVKNTAYSCSGANPYLIQYRGDSTGDCWMPAALGLTFPLSQSGEVRYHNFETSQTDISNLITEAVTECWNNRGRSDSNLWEAIAEIDKSLTIGSQALTNLNDFLHKNRKELAKYKAIGNSYLLWRYGLSPLISDVNAALKGLQKATGEVRQTHRGKAVLSSNKTTIGPTLGSFGAYKVDTVCTTSEVIQIRATSLDDITVTLSSNLGLTTKGLLTLPYELIPYSFVVDWVVNLGSYLGALVPAIGEKQLVGGYCIERTLSHQWSPTRVYITRSDITGVLDPQPGNAYYTFQERHRIPGLPSPGLVIKSDFRLDKLTRLADAAALLLQKFR